MKRVFIAVFGLLLCNVIFAAAPVTHVVLAEQWIALQEDYSEDQKREFILGTLFPDIRYLGVVSRAETHEKGVNLARLVEPQSAFKKGMRLHVFVDETRERLIAKWKIYRLLKDIPGGRHHKTLFLKLLEDEILFVQGKWSKIRGFLSTIDDAEICFGIQKDDVRKWHSHQMMAFCTPPSLYLNYFALTKKSFAGVSPDIIAQWTEILPKLAENKVMRQYVESLVKEFDKIFAKA